MGKRYSLQKVLGYGSFSCVCLALDNSTGERVALKRIGDVLHSADQAKRVLREIAILRRTSHPNLIGLRDCFLRPSSTGQCRMINGRLVNTSIDLYIAMEFADGGDLFHMRGQLAPEEVTSLLWQLLQSVNYLHSMHVWHRDVKSQNAFIHWEGGVRVVKLGDFGSARSALQHDLDLEMEKNGERRRPVSADGRPLITSDRSFHEMAAAMESDDLYAQPARDMPYIDTGNESELLTGSEQGKQQHLSLSSRFPTPHTNGSTGPVRFHPSSSSPKGFKAPLTRVVATPCYRAPEVVMSRGGYTSALDMWGIGCIFGELLQRVAYVGSAATPNLSVAPLFALRCMPKTPETGETFGWPECLGTRRELAALFDVIGTPSWRDAASVEMPEWRKYLGKMPGKAPSLYRRFKPAGEVAIHLLSRMLDFDPAGRASCDEALAHEFFAGMREELRIRLAAREDLRDAEMAEIADREAAEALAVVDTGDQRDVEEEEEEVERMASNGSPLAKTLRQMSFDGPGLIETLSVDAAAAAATQGAVALPVEELAIASPEGPPCWEESNPGKALALLEEVIEEVSIDNAGLVLDPASEGYQKLRELLEAECKAAAEEAASRTAHRATSGPGGSRGVIPVPDAAAMAPTGTSALRDVFSRPRIGLQEDVRAQDQTDYGKERLSNVADTWQGRELDPRKFLGGKRHGEWTAQGGGGGPAPGPRWGVTAAPPGLNPDDPRVQAIVKQQQGR